ncbi:FtsQ-type POTRA domain-containing protein, partial [Patescibacteria group bacterium]|nr:FtsQ-type POTRA domain-containing protein [Patescibacteria group bacterium]
MAKPRRRIRQMPKIYGNLQKAPRSYAGVGRFFKWLFWSALFIGVMYVFFFSEAFTINKVEVDGAHFVSAADVSRYLPVGTNIWLFSEARLRDQILRDDRVESVAIYRGLPDSVKIVIVEKQPSMLWVSGNTTAVLDSAGVPFMLYPSNTFPAPTTALGSYLSRLVTVRDTKSLPIGLNRQITSPLFIRFVQKVRSQIQTYLPTLTLDHYEVADTTYDVTFVATQGMRVQFNSLGDAGVQVRNLVRLVGQGKATYKSQVDLRIDRWA